MKNNSTLKKVQYTDAVAASKEYFGGDELAATVWVSKYALKDSQGNIYEKDLPCGKGGRSTCTPL